MNQQTLEQLIDAVEDLTAHMQELEEQPAAIQDQVLRVVADLQNVRRHVEQDVERVHKLALEKLAGDLLAMVDALKCGPETSDPNNEAIKLMREGMELTLKMFDDTLRRYQAEVLSPEGEPFNPEQHQVMTMQESASTGPSSVLKVSQKGYLLNDHLLCSVMVVVSKAPVETPPSIGEQA